MKIDVCLEMILTDQPVAKRMKVIAEAGYEAVEFWHYDATFDGHANSLRFPKDPAELRQLSKEYGLEIVCIGSNTPDGAVGGSPVDSRQQNRFLERLEEAMAFAAEVSCPRIIVLAGQEEAALTRNEMRANLERTLSVAANTAAKRGIVLLLEPLNLVDHPGYYLDSTEEAFEIVRAVNNPSLKILYDIYHMQVMEGNIISRLESAIGYIGHFHAAGVPGRHELFLGELNYANIVKRIGAAGYEGFFGLEYLPSLADASVSLRKTAEYLASGAVSLLP